MREKQIETKLNYYSHYQIDNKKKSQHTLGETVKKQAGPTAG